MTVANRARRANLGWLGASAAGIGVLMGLSTSPVAGIAVTALLGAAAAVATVLIGTDKVPGQSRNISAFPLFVLVAAVLVGTVGGVYLRTRRLPPDAASVEGTITRWSKITGLPDTVVARRIFAGARFDAFGAGRAEEMEVHTNTVDPCPPGGWAIVSYDSQDHPKGSLSAGCDSSLRILPNRKQFKRPPNDR